MWKHPGRGAESQKRKIPSRDRRQGTASSAGILLKRLEKGYSTIRKGNRCTIYASVKRSQDTMRGKQRKKSEDVGGKDRDHPQGWWGRRYSGRYY